MRIHQFHYLLLLLFPIFSQAQVENQLIEAQDSVSDFFRLYEIPTVKIIAAKSRMMSEVPGSGTYLPLKAINQLQPLSGNEVLRQISGIHVVEEEGIGLRANIGIRGLDPDRSAKVLILEDGIPVALNPFGEPQLYYTPTMDRMEGVEVLKGSGQILFGPQTIGGVINYITADPPKEQKGIVKLKGGQGNYLSGLFGLGNTYGNVGYQINYLRKQADQVGPTNFRLNDITGKIKMTLGNRSKLGIKLGFYDEVSNSTYVGLSQTLFEKGEFDFETLAINDVLQVDRLSASLTHETHWNYKLKLQTTAFGYKTERNWQRQDFKNSTQSDYDYVIGNAGEEGAIYFLDKNGHRNRQFEVAGVEPRLTWRFGNETFDHKFEGGLRLLFERAFEQRVNGTKGDAPSGVLKNDEIRTGKAFSAYVQDQLTIKEKFVITGGLRMESYNFERDIHRLNEVDTSIVANQNIVQVIPGLGFNYNIGKNSGVFAGIHRGFAPPRIKDAIASSGEVYQLEPELSWNFELGWRANIYEMLGIELTVFHMDFSNQIIPISESSGGAGTGFINGGKSLHQGIELGTNWKIGKLWNYEGDLTWTNNLTLLKATYNADRFEESGSESININGNRTPYTPQTTLTSMLNFETPKGFKINITGNYLGQQYTDELNSESPSANGRIGSLPSYFILDAGIGYQFLNKKLELSLSGKNLLNERYIASRRPQGIRVGMARYISGGLTFRF